MKTPDDSKLRAEANILGKRLHALETEIKESDSSMHVVFSWYRGDEPSEQQIREALLGVDEEWTFAMEAVNPVTVACRKRSRKYHRTVVITSITYYYKGTWSAGVFTRAIH